MFFKSPCATGPVLDPIYRPWTPRPALIPFNPSYSHDTIILTSAFPSCSAPLGVYESHPRTQSGFHFFFSTWEVPWEKPIGEAVTMTRRLFSFCENKRSHWGLSLHPEQAPGREEVGHNEHKVFLCFAPGLGNRQRRVKQSTWLVHLYWKIETKGKGEKEGDRGHWSI